MTKKLNFETSLLEYGEVNSGFAKVKISVLTHEQVANGTKFTKEVIDKRASGLNYLPVIGEFKEDDNDFGTHGGKLEISDDGFEFIDTTKPYGVVISDSYRWEDIKMKNGETVPYLVCSAYLWIDRYPELNALYEGKLNNQSMEIKVLEGKFNEDTWVYEIDDFEFSACCILGKTVQPAFNEAKIDVNFQKEDFKLQYEEMITALNKYLENHEQSEVINKMTKAEFEEETVKTEEQVEEVTETDVEEVEKTEDEVIEETVEEETVEEKTTKTEEEFTKTDEVIEDAVNYKELYEALKTQHDELQVEVETLREYKDTNEYQKEYSLKMTKIDSFKGKLTEEDLQPIIENIDSYSVEQVEDKCFAILGRKNITTYSLDPKQKNKTVTLTGGEGHKRSWLDEL